MLWAEVPNKPTNAPVSDTSVTTAQMIKINYQAVIQTNGAVILSYELQVATPNFNDWRTLVGANPYSLALTYNFNVNISRGHDYSFRYRAINSVG